MQPRLKSWREHGVNVTHFPSFSSVFTHRSHRMVAPMEVNQSVHEESPVLGRRPSTLPFVVVHLWLSVVNGRHCLLLNKVRQCQVAANANEFHHKSSKYVDSISCYARLCVNFNCTHNITAKLSVCYCWTVFRVIICPHCALVYVSGLFFPVEFHCHSVGRSVSLSVGNDCKFCKRKQLSQQDSVWCGGSAESMYKEPCIRWRSTSPPWAEANFGEDGVVQCNI